MLVKPIDSMINRENRNVVNDNFRILGDGLSTSISKSEQALTKSNAVEKRVNDLIIDSGTSDAEVIASRTDSISGESFDSLSSRLDEQNEAVVQRLEQVNDATNNKTPINSYDEGMIGNRAVDESTFLQNAINKAIQNGLKKLIIPDATYRLENPVFVPDSIEIEMQNPTFEWYGQGTISGNASNALIGIFNYHGKIRGGDSILPYLRSVANGAHNPPTQATQLLTFTQDYMRSRFTVGDISRFDVGDWVLLMGWTRPEGYPYDIAKIEPELRKMVQIVDKDSNYLYTDYQSPITYKNMVYNDKFKSVAIPVKPLQDIKITGGYKVVDKINSPADSSGNPINGQSDDAPSLISTILVNNFTHGTFEASKHRFNAMMINYTNSIKLDDIVAKNAQWWGGGKGYAIQLNGCRIIEVANVLSDGCRHAVDFSWSSEADVYKARALNSKGFDLTMHGYAEHNITWHECVGSICMNHFYEMIPEIVKNITFKSCDVRFAANGYTGYADNIVFENCSVNTSELSLYNIVKFKECEITLRSKATYDKPNNRDSLKDSAIVIENCMIRPQYAAGQLTYGIVGYDNVAITSSTLSPVDAIKNLSTVTSLLIVDAKKTTIDDLVNDYMNITINQSKYPVSVFNLLNSFITHKTKTGLAGLTFANANGKTFYCGMHNNTITFEALNAGDNLPVYTASGVSINNCDITITMSDNKLIGSLPESINSALGTGNATTLRLIDYKNLIKNKKTGAIYNPTENIFI